MWQRGRRRLQRHAPYVSTMLHRRHNKRTTNWAAAWDFQQFDILTSVDSDEPVQPPFKLRNSKWRSVSSLTIIEYSSDKQRLWSDCAYAQAGLRLCWSHIPHCWKSHALAQLECLQLYCTILSINYRHYLLAINNVMDYVLSRKKYVV